MYSIDKHISYKYVHTTYEHIPSDEKKGLSWIECSTCFTVAVTCLMPNKISKKYKKNLIIFLFFLIIE